jgi:DNA polymerase III delta prime subunit
MNGLSPDRLDDFLLSNAQEKALLEMILSHQLPFPFAGKSGILIHGTWGTGKSTLVTLLPELIDTSYAGTYDLSKNIGQMTPDSNAASQTKLFRCGSVNIAQVTQNINSYSSRSQLLHHSHQDYFVFDEIDRLTTGAQQSLRSTMDLKRCMFFFSTNYLGKIDTGIINRCHLIEMNQIANNNAYLPLGLAILQQMGLKSNAISAKTFASYAQKAKGSVRSFATDVVVQGVLKGGSMPV